MPRDPDKLQELESRQQRLVEEIISSLHHATRDRDYEKIFHKLAKSVLIALEYKDPSDAQGLQVWFSTYIWRSITEFTDDPLERRHLLRKVLEKLLVPVYASASGPYERALIHNENLQEAPRAPRGTTPTGEGSEFPVT
jgi:hypothetical protein